jgi:hypothetical protein
VAGAKQSEQSDDWPVPPYKEEENNFFKTAAVKAKGAYRLKSDRFSRSKSFRRSAKIVFLYGVTGRCGGAEIQFLHSGAAAKLYPGEIFRSTEVM